MTETQALTIADFLLARIAEDEARAHPETCFGDERCEPECTGSNPRCGRRILAECAAKRRIVDLARDADREHAMSIPGTVGQMFAGRASLAEAMLRALASAYANHADFRPEWRL